MNTTPTTTGAAPALCQQHLDLLAARAITPEIATEAGLRSIDLRDLRKIKEAGGRIPWPGLPTPDMTGIEIPYHLALDNIPRCRVRVDDTHLPAEEEGGTVITEGREIPRYLAQAKVGVIPYITRQAFDVADDVNVPICITEAPLKALAMVSIGLPAIGLGGVLAGAHDRDALSGTRQILAHRELRRLRWAARKVFILFDAGVSDHDDHMGNPDVALGAAYVSKALGDLRADVWLVQVPYHHALRSEPERGDVWRAEDQGPDDYLARHGVSAFTKLLETAVPADPVRRIQSALTGVPDIEKPVVTGKLLKELFFASTLNVGGDVVTSAVAAVTKGTGIGKVALRDGARAFGERARARSKVDEPEWTSKLSRFGSGVPRPTRENVELCLRNDAGLVDLVSYDEFGQRLVFRRSPPWTERYKAAMLTSTGAPWSDEDDLRLGGHLAEKHDLLDLDPRKLRAAVTLVGRDQPVHPVRDFLNHLRWDGTKRVESWLTTFLGVQASAYTSNVGRWWLISAVARVLTPGCKADYTLILEGPQGLRKSSALRVLGGQWFSDGDLGDLKSKEAAMQLGGTWIREWPEGAIFSRASTRAVKAFSTIQEDDFVPKFSNLRTRVPRQCVFSLTTNDMEYLADSTGNRRWWPVRCTSIDLDGLRSAREQLFAEAVALFREGVLAYPDTAEEIAMCEAAQGERQVSDPWEDVITDELVNTEERITVSEILTRVLDIDIGRQRQGDRIRVTDCLRRVGWENRRSHGARLWVRGPRAAPFTRRRDDDGELVTPGPFNV